MGALVPVELTAAWEPAGPDVALRVRDVRAFEPGAAHHHPTFVVPDLPASDLPEEGTEPEVPWGIDVRDPTDLDARIGQPVSLHGVLAGDGLSTILDVEVSSDETLRGQSVVAVGLLKQWSLRGP